MKKRVMTGATVIADLDRATYFTPSMEDYAKQLERAVKEFHNFILDHRSMDWVSLHVHREYEDRCTHCDFLWNVDTDGVPACCDKAVEEHEAQAEITSGPSR